MARQSGRFTGSTMSDSSVNVSPSRVNRSHLPVLLSSVAVIGSSNVRPSKLYASWARAVSGPSQVRPTDQAVVFHGPGMASSVLELRNRMGSSMPPTLVAAPRLDIKDVVSSLQWGARSYLTSSQHPDYLIGAVKATVAGSSFLDPEITSALIKEIVGNSSREGTTATQPRSTDMTHLLSPRESQIMDELAAGRTVAEAADRLALSEKTVRNYLSSVYTKLSVRRQTEAILLWVGGRLSLSS